MKFKELWGGTQKEHEAQETLEDLKGRPLKPRQQRRFNDAEKISRRHFLRKVGIVGAGVGVVGSGAVVAGQFLSAEFTKTSSFSWEQTEYAKLPRLNTKELQEIFNYLEDTKYPLLQKVARDGKTLTTSSTPPSEIPYWIDRNSFPLRVILDKNSRDSAIINFTSKIENLDQKKFIGVDDIGKTVHPEISGIIAAIQIGTLPLEEKDTGLKAFLFAKEYFGFLTNIAIAEEFYPMIEKFAPSYKLTDMQGNPLVDLEKQRQAGRTIFYTNLDRGTDIWNIADGFPMLLLAPAIIYLSIKQKLPEDLMGITGFAYASRLAADKGEAYLKYLMETVNNWTFKNDFLLPKGTGTRALQDPHVSLIFELQRKLGNKK